MNSCQKNDPVQRIDQEKHHEAPIAKHHDEVSQLPAEGFLRDGSPRRHFLVQHQVDNQHCEAAEGRDDIDEFVPETVAHEIRNGRPKKGADVHQPVVDGEPQRARLFVRRDGHRAQH